jgi:Ca-activated chloride channel homolog
MGFNELSKLWFLSLLIPVVVFYFLKLRRPKVRVPSLFLWQQVMNDQRVNSPFQRFKKHLLLLLQLLILAFLVLAATDPYFIGNLNKAKRVPILIDNSASMGALDKETKESRLQKAKEKIEKLIEDKVSGQEFALISYSDRAKKICGFTDNSKILLDSLDKVKVDDVPANIEDALRMVQAMAKNFHFNEALLFSDGNFPAKADFNLSFQLNFQKIKDETPNLGITALSAQRAGNENWVIFAEMNSTGKAPPATIELYRNGDLAAEETYVPEKDNAERITFTVPGGMESFLELRVKPDGFDALTSDNTAYIQLPKLRPLWVYVSPGLKTVRSAISGMQGVSLNDPEDLSSAGQEYDLYITDQPANVENQSRVLLTTGFIPDKLKSILATENKEVTLVDWKKEDPLLCHAQLGELSIMEGSAFVKGQNAKDLEKLGYSTAMYGTLGPLLLKKEWAGQTAYYMLFNIDRSTLPYRIAFPIMIKNLIELTRRQAGLSDVIANRTGILPKLQLLSETEFSVKSPTGTVVTEKTGNDGRLPAILATKTGNYTISKAGIGEGDKIITGVSLLDKDETLLAGTDTITFNELSVAAEAQSAKAPQSLWKYLAILALFILFAEWWFFNKRPRRIKVK